METGNFGFESVSSENDDGKDKKKKIGSIVAGEVKPADKSENGVSEPDIAAKGELLAKSLLRRITGEETPAEPLKRPTEATVAAIEAQVAAEALPLDTLTKQEKVEAAEAYVEARLDEVEGGTSPEDLAAQELLEADQRHLAVEGVEVEGVPEAAYREVIEAQALETTEEVESEHAVGSEREADIPLDAPVEAADGEGGGAEPPHWWSRFNFNGGGEQAPQASAPAASKIERNDTARNTRRATARGLLVGGLIYWIGRRRGRIKTERREAKVRQKLEGELATIENQFAATEQRVRILARQKAELLETVDRQELYGTAPAEQVSEAKVQRSERLGSVTLHAVESAKSAEKPAPHTAGVETMGRTELLVAAEKIVVGATTLRRVFETHLISERGLRRAVSEHLSGGNLNKVLSEELILKELSYERDPILRDKQSLREETGRSRSAPGLDADSQPAHTEQAEQQARSQETVLASRPADGLFRRQTLRRKLVTANLLALAVLGVLLVVLLIIYR